MTGTTTQEQSQRARVFFFGVLALALGLRLVNALTASLHLDDFHSLHHARAEGWGSFFHGLLQDNHPPLSFLVLRGVRSLFGEAELALRLPGLAYALGTVGLVWRMGRRLPDTWGRALACALVAVSSLHLENSTDLRMYALLALVVAGFLDACVDMLEDGVGAARGVLWAILGLHTHYHFLHLLLVLGGTIAALLLFAPAYRARRSAFLKCTLVVLVLCLPWYILGFRQQLAHELMPGGSEVSRTLFAEGMLHLVFLNLGLGSELGRWLFLAGGGVLVTAALVSAVRLVRPSPTRAVDACGALWFAGAWLLPIWTALAAALFTRAGFEWRYLIGAVPPFALLVGHAATDGRLAGLRRSVLGLALVAAAWLCVLNALDPGRENYKGAVRIILDEATPRDAVLPADWSPKLFPHGLAWHYYAPLLADGRELPQRLEHTGQFDLAPDVELSSYPRVFGLLRSIPEGTSMIERLRAHFPRETTRTSGAAIYIVTFESAARDD